ncbi:MAG: MotA/TolQ/ExbB proton channel family protein [Opitutales bacterium]|nr:MotA/TolQ/ExbB proton channel family protein [Opitutales bacterium]PHX58701.1 MAG: flagellar motor protein MotA [Opitutae bacterium]
MLCTVLPIVLAAETEKGALWYFRQMDSAGLAVAAVLVICSFIGWGAMIQKWSDVQELRRRNHGFDRRLRDQHSVIALNFPGSGNLCPYEFLVAEAVSAVQRHKGRLVRQSDVRLCMGHVENALQRGLSRTMVKYEDKMVILSSLVSGGPFLGLLGTVWGVMVTFGALTEKASIAQLAPGVCGALVTTTLGLLVAIPATFGYNYLLTQVKIMSTELENFASTLADRVELELEAEARLNFEQQQQRELLRRAVAQAAAVSAPASAAPVPAAEPAAPGELPGWEDAQ